MKDRFQEGNSSPINVPANANDNADDSTKESTPLGLLTSDVQDGNIPNQQQPVTLHSMSQQPSYQGQTSMKVQEPTSNATGQSHNQLPPVPQYHSIRDKVIGELNEMPK